MDEKTKQELLEELRKEYSVTLKPLKEKQFSVADILKNHHDEIYNKLGIKEKHWRYTEQIDCNIRKIMCYKYGVWTTKDILPEQREQFRKDLEKFITDFILTEV